MPVVALNLALDVGGSTVIVSLFDSQKWVVAGDPKSLFAEHEGVWARHPTVGVQINSAASTLVDLVGFDFRNAKVGDSGDALLYLETNEGLGTFKVVQVEVD